MQPATSVFKDVPKTGVIYVMTEARKKGFYYGHPDWANLGQGAPETGPIEGGAERLTTIHLDAKTSEYSPVAGSLALRTAVAKLYNARYREGMNSQYTAENVAISSGGRAGLTRVAATLGSVNLGHFLPDYTAYEELLDLFKAFVPIPVPLRAEHEFMLSPDALRSEILGRGLGALLLSNPCNPTGQVLRGGALRAWVDICRTFSVALIFDEFYSHYLYGDALKSDAPALSAARYVKNVNEDPVVMIDGLTKNWRYPGMRLSWTVGPNWLIERLASSASFLDGGANHAVQAAAIPLLSPEVANQEARAIQNTFGKKRDRMVQRLRAMGIVVTAPQGAFYCFADIGELPAPLNQAHSFFQEALKRQVICVPGPFFDVDPGKRRDHIRSRLHRFVRLSFGPQLSELERGLDRLEQMILSCT